MHLAIAGEEAKARGNDEAEAARSAFSHEPFRSPQAACPRSPGGRRGRCCALRNTFEGELIMNSVRKEVDAVIIESLSQFRNPIPTVREPVSILERAANLMD